MVLAIKNFRKKVLKAKDSPIYIKVISLIPDWNHEENYSPYHFIEIGLASSKKELQPSTAKKDDPDRSLLDTLAKIRVQNLRRIAEQILHAISEGERKINYADRHCIITSRSLAGSSEEDILALQQYSLPFLKNTIEASESDAKCQQVPIRQVTTGKRHEKHLKDRLAVDLSSSSSFNNNYEFEHSAFLEAPRDSFEVLKLLENSMKVLKILENKLESMKILENKLESLKP
nr:hypothetical protein [Tanacetum cinerariifolium]